MFKKKCILLRLKKKKVITEPVFLVNRGVLWKCQYVAIH